MYRRLKLTRFDGTHLLREADTNLKQFFFRVELIELGLSLPTPGFYTSDTRHHTRNLAPHRGPQSSAAKVKTQEKSIQKQAIINEIDLGALFELSWDVLGLSWRQKRAHIALGMGVLWHFGDLGLSWGCVKGVLGPSWGRLEVVLGASGAVLERLGGVSEASWSVFGTSWAGMGSSTSHFPSILTFF